MNCAIWTRQGANSSAINDVLLDPQFASEDISVCTLQKGPAEWVLSENNNYMINLLL